VTCGAYLLPGNESRETSRYSPPSVPDGPSEGLRNPLLGRRPVDHVRDQLEQFSLSCSSVGSGLDFDEMQAAESIHTDEISFLADRILTMNELDLGSGEQGISPLR
jgi:hypothetical protein